MTREAAAPSSRTRVVLDTNVSLDLLLFDDPSTRTLRAALDDGQLDWIATEAMGAEFARVLGYPAIARQCLTRGRSAQALQAAWFATVRIVPEPGATAVRCSDPDDQGFIDLALRHGALLLSRDRAVLQLAHRLASSGVTVRSAFDASVPDGAQD